MNKVQVLIIILFIFYRILENAAYRNDVIRILDIGQGDAMLLRLGRRIVLVDGGPSFEIDRYLSKEFIGNYCHIDLIVLSHPHADHVKGLNRVLKRCQVDAVAFSDIEYASNLHKEWQSLVKNVPKIGSKPGSELFFGDFRFEFLWPGAAHVGSNINNASLSFVLHRNDFHALFLGDLESEALGELSKIPALESLAGELDFYKVPHHGSRGAIDENLLVKLNPKICGISAGEDNKFGHPHSETLDSLVEVGCQVFRTDREGTIELHIN